MDITENGKFIEVLVPTGDSERDALAAAAPELAPGRYQLRVEARGYAPLVFPDLTLQPNEVLTMEISLVTVAAVEARSRLPRLPDLGPALSAEEQALSGTYREFRHRRSRFQAVHHQLHTVKTLGDWHRPVQRQSRLPRSPGILSRRDLCGFLPHRRQLSDQPSQGATRNTVPTFRSSCSFSAPTFANFGKSWAQAKPTILAPLSI